METVLKAKQKLIEGYPGPENDLVAIKLTDRISDLAHGWAESGDFRPGEMVLDHRPMQLEKYFQENHFIPCQKDCFFSLQ